MRRAWEQGLNGALGLGAYVHIPFCSTRCDYCAFAIWTEKSELIDRYVDALVSEVESARAAGTLRELSTVYFGGGTPSLIGGARLARLLEVLPVRSDAEVTVECNPESTTPQLLQALCAAGVTRISLGVQSLSPLVLASLGRTHRDGDARRAIELVATAGFASFNVDLIYGANGETDELWEKTLRAVIDGAAAPPHISAYALTVERGTPLSRDPRRHPDDDVEARRYEIADEILESAGYSWYELSNWSLPGHYCRHNWATWMHGEYLGFGCSAHSYVAGRRFANIFDVTRYLERIETGRSPVVSEERLEPSDQEIERLELRLRTRAGVPESSLPSAFVSDGLIATDDGQAILTRRGRLLTNEVSIALRPATAEEPRPPEVVNQAI